MLQLSDKELERLPLLFRQIVLNQRRIEEIACAPVASFEMFKGERNVRIEYRRAAELLYHPIGSRGGPATA